MQDSTGILLDRQLFATKANLRQVIASLDGGPDCFAYMVVGECPKIGVSLLKSPNTAM